MNIIKYLIDIIYTQVHHSPCILDIDDTINRVIENNLSVARFGDGEFDIMLKKQDIGFQKNDDELGNKLKEVLISKDENLLVCLPKVFAYEDLARMHHGAKRCWIRFLYKNRRSIYKQIRYDKTYGDAFITRNYMDLKDRSKSGEYFNKIKKIWDKRDIIIIEGKYTRFGVGNDLLSNAKSLKRILCPEKDAYAKYKDILACVRDISKSTLILLALGPTATVLAADLCSLSYQAIDIGHLDIEYEWYLTGATSKIAVCNKWVNETNWTVDENTDMLDDDDYLHSIIKIIE